MVDRLVREKWYLVDAHLYEMVKSLRFKYLSCKKEKRDGEERAMFTRYYMAYNVDLLRRAIIHLNAHREHSKLYYDLATWRRGEMMLFSWNPAVRREQRKEWDSKSKAALDYLDFAIDLDAPNTEKWKSAWKEALKIDAFLNDKKNFIRKKYGRMPVYSVRWSGKKGFHFVIPGEFFEDLYPKSPEKWVANHVEMARRIQRELKLKLLDYSIYDYDRVLALPYSLSDAGMVVLPLSREQLASFSLEMVDPEWAVKNITMRGRGLIWNNEEVTEEDPYEY